jgi:hypothetical protein
MSGVFLIFVWTQKKGMRKHSQSLILQNYIMLATKIAIPFGIDKTQIKGEGPYVVIMDVTPQLAEYWLKNNNKKNRPLTRSTVLFYIKQQKEGKWIGLNGTTIKFGENKDLVDAQHRLASIAESGVTVRTIVVIGVPEGSFMTLDTGRSRSGGDSLAILGYENYSLLASTSAFLLNWMKGKQSQSASRNGSGSGDKLDNNDIVDFVEKNSTKLEPYCKLAYKNYLAGGKLVTPTWLAGLLFVMAKRHSVMAEKFIFELATGSGVELGTPMYALRQKLYRSKHNDDKKISSEFKLAYIVKTWNAIRLGKEIKLLRYKKGDTFPKMA